MSYDFASDFDFIDEVETVTYQRRSLDDTPAVEYADVKALKRATVGGLVTVGNAEVMTNISRWHIKAASLAVEPRRGDRIVSLTKGTWEVMSDDVQVFANRYECTCRKVS